MQVDSTADELQKLLQHIQSLIPLNQFEEAALHLKEGLGKFPNQLSLLVIANEVHRAIGNRELSLEHALKLASNHPNDWNGFGRAAEDLLALNRFDDARSMAKEGLKLISGDEHLNDIYFQANESKKAVEDFMLSDHASLLQGFISNSEKVMTSIFPLGNGCRAAQYLKDTGIRSMAMPFDWLRCNAFVIADIIDNDFKKFLKMEYLWSQYPDRKCWHWLYGHGEGGRIFGHHDPAREPDRTAFVRRVERFREVSRDSSPKVFLNVGSSDEGLNELLERLGPESKIINFNFKPLNESHLPQVSVKSSRLLKVQFYCDGLNTLFSRKARSANAQGEFLVTDGLRVYCPYSNVYAYEFLKSLKQCCYH